MLKLLKFFDQENDYRVLIILLSYEKWRDIWIFLSDRNIISIKTENKLDFFQLSIQAIV